ncbi:hypothetical protein D3C85_1088670 [compost metagenome]
MFEIAFVETSRCQQHHQRHFFIARRLSGQGFLKRTEEASEMLHLQVAVQLGKGPGHDGAVFQCITGTGRRLSAVRCDPPATIGGTRQIHRIQMQKSPVRRIDALTGPEEIVVAEHQFGR